MRIRTVACNTSPRRSKALHAFPNDRDSRGLRESARPACAARATSGSATGHLLPTRSRKAATPGRGRPPSRRGACTGTCRTPAPRRRGSRTTAGRAGRAPGWRRRTRRRRCAGAGGARAGRRPRGRGPPPAQPDAARTDRRAGRVLGQLDRPHAARQQLGDPGVQRGDHPLAARRRHAGAADGADTVRPARANCSGCWFRRSTIRQRPSVPFTSSSRRHGSKRSPIRPCGRWSCRCRRSTRSRSPSASTASTTAARWWRKTTSRPGPARSGRRLVRGADDESPRADGMRGAGPHVASAILEPARATA